MNSDWGIITKIESMHAFITFISDTESFVRFNCSEMKFPRLNITSLLPNMGYLAKAE